MPNVTITETVTLVVVTCGTCGVTHAIPEKLRDTFYKTSGYWHCPNGHQWGYGESEADRVRKSLREAEQRLQIEIAAKTKAQADAAFYKAEADQSFKEARRLRKRVSAGVCPCCTRTFQNLQRHMATKHPEVAA